jgi:hypothetical protein
VFFFRVSLVVNVYTKQRPGRFDGNKIIARLSFAEEFSARSWAQVSEGII